MYQYDSKSKTQPEKSKENTPATNKGHAQVRLKMPMQTKSLFVPSFNRESFGENPSSVYTSRPTLQRPILPYSPLQMQLMPKQADKEPQPLPVKLDEEQKRLTTGPRKTNNTGIPLQMKEKFEHLSGFSFDDVRVHYNSDKPVQLQALAYTQGNQVYISSGQEKHLGHELGHVVQQKQKYIPAQHSIGGQGVNADNKLEQEAERMGFMFQNMIPSNSESELNNGQSNNVIQGRFVGNLVSYGARFPFSPIIPAAAANNNICHSVSYRNIMDAISSPVISFLGYAAPPGFVFSGIPPIGAAGTVLASLRSLCIAVLGAGVAIAMPAPAAVAALPPVLGVNALNGVLAVVPLGGAAPPPNVLSAPDSAAVIAAMTPQAIAAVRKICVLLQPPMLNYLQAVAPGLPPALAVLLPPAPVVAVVNAGQNAFMAINAAATAAAQAGAFGIPVPAAPLFPAAVAAVTAMAAPMVAAAVLGIPAVTAAVMGIPGMAAAVLGIPAVTAAVMGIPGMAVAVLGLPGIAAAVLALPAVLAIPGIAGAVLVAQPAVILAQPGVMAAIIGAPGVAAAVMGMPGVAAAIIGAPGVAAAVMGMPGIAAAIIGAPGVAAAVMGMPGVAVATAAAAAAAVPAVMPLTPAVVGAVAAAIAPEIVTEGLVLTNIVGHANDLLYILHNSPFNLRYGSAHWNMSVQENFDPQEWVVVTNLPPAAGGQLATTNSHVNLNLPAIPQVGAPLPAPPAMAAAVPIPPGTQFPGFPAAPFPAIIPPAGVPGIALNLVPNSPGFYIYNPNDGIKLHNIITGTHGYGRFSAVSSSQAGNQYLASSSNSYARPNIPAKSINHVYYFHAGAWHSFT